MFLSLHLFSFLMVSAAIIFTVNHQQRAQALVEAQEKARLILDHNLAIHSYFSNQLKPQLFQLTDRYLPKEYFNPVWMSSTYAVREIDLYNKIFSNSDFYYKECAINARSPRNEADPVERAFLEEIRKDPRLAVKSFIREIYGRPFFVVMRRGESMEKSCLRCHSTPAAAPGDMVTRYGGERSFSRHDGELVSAISIRIPLHEAYVNANKLSFELCILLLAILGVSSAAQLQEALAKVRTLEGVLPICSYCKKIRTDQESWQQLEHYISEHSDALFSHGICPSCFDHLKDGFKKRGPRGPKE